MYTLSLYYYIYFSVFFLYFFYLYIRNKNGEHYSTYFLIIFLSFLAGMRSVKIGSDTPMYIHFFESRYNNIATITETFPQSLLASPLYYLIVNLIKDATNSHIVYFTLNASISLFVTFKFCQIFSNEIEKKTSSLLFCMTCITFTFIDQQINTIRIGAAFGFIYMYLYYYFKNQRKQFILYFILAALIHITAVFPFICALIAKRLKVKLWVYYLIYATSILLIYFNIGIHRISDVLLNYDYDKISFYFGGDNLYKYKVGFRIDFIAYNTLFLVLFSFLSKKNNLIKLYLKYYIIASSLFFLYLYIPHSDRIGSFSWGVIPIILFFGISTTYPKNRPLLLISFIALLIISTILIPH